jgi:hypothetical protein
MRAVVSAVVSIVACATLASGCYFGKTTANRRNATMVNASLVLVGAVAVLYEPDAMGRLPTNADTGDEIAGTSRMIGGTAAIVAGIAGIVMNLRTHAPAPEAPAAPASVMPMALADEVPALPGGRLPAPAPYPSLVTR